jgi:hypothetical protein
MSLEMHLTRLEIRRKVCAILGWSSAATSQVQVADNLNELITEANEEVLLRRKWVNRKARARFTLGIDQRTATYPKDCGPEAVIDVGVWDTAAQLYLPVRRKIIRMQFDNGPLLDVDPSTLGDTDAEEAARAMPVWWEPIADPQGLATTGVMQFFPLPDQAYDIQVYFMDRGALAADEDISVIDGQAIVFYATAQRFLIDGDQASHANQMQKFERRIGLLSGLQASGEAIAIDADAVFTDDRFDELGVPRYDFTTGRGPGI